MPANKHQSVRSSEQRLVRLAAAWESLFDDIGAVDIVSMEFAFHFLTGEVVLHRLKNERLRKVLAGLLRKNEPWELAKPASLYAIRILLALELSHGYNERTASLVESGTHLLDQGQYVRAILTALQELIESAEQLDDRLYYLLQNLAAAFILRGFDISRIRRLMSEMFFDDSNIVEGLMHSTFPYELIEHHLPELDPTSNESLATYNAALTRKLELLTLSDRFEAIFVFYQQRPRTLTYIFAVTGLKGRRTHSIGRIELYPPFTAPKVDRTMELFGRDATDSLNVAITMPSLGSDEDRSRAAQLVQGDLDPIGFYITPTVPIEVDSRQCVMIGSNGALYGVAARNDRLDAAVEHRYLARDMDELAAHPASLKTLVDVATKLAGESTNFEVRAYEALRAMSKSVESGVLEDRLVNAWISIEALMGTLADKESVATEVIPSLVVTDARWLVGWGLLRYLRRRFANYNLNRHDAVFDKVSEDLLKRSLVTFEPWRSQDLSDFIATLDEWVVVAREDQELSRRFVRVGDFYRNPREAKKELFHRYQIARRYRCARALARL
jgi:hypothetical protein